jgi:hypothetical protein
VRRHAKAATAGSNQRRANGFGRSQLTIAALVLFAASVVLALLALSAGAAQQRNHEGSFGSFTGQDPRAITVDQSNGDIYVVSTATNKVSRFNASGLPKNFTAGPDAGTNTLTGLGFQNFPSLDQVAIDNSGGPSNGNIYVTQSGAGAVKVFASSGAPLGTLNGSGTPAGSLGEDCGVAVDQSNGDLYVASYSNRIWRYSPSTSLVTEANYSGGIATSIEPCQLAVATGSLYAHNWKESPIVGFGPVRKYATSEFATGSPPSPPSTVLDSGASAVAADPSNGDVYVDEGNKIAVYSSSGGLKYSFGSAADFGSASAGVAVRVGGAAYVSDPVNHQVDVYGPFSAPPPIVETKAATGVGHVKATLNGHLDPNNSLPIAGCEFEWGTTTGYGSSIPCAEGGSFNAAADVSAQLSGLTPGTTYHFRLHVTTGSGGFDGEDKSFEAAPPSSVPEAETGQGTILSSTSAGLSGSVNPNANPLTGCHFEYVNDLYFQVTGFTDLSSGGSVPCDQAPGSIPADFEDHQVTATVTGLDSTQIYRFRLVAENANGTGSGSNAYIPGPSLVETMGSTYRTATTARLDSRLVPHGAPTAYHFEYGDQGPCDANPCTATQSHPAGSGNEFVLVSQQLTGLSPSTTYHYRLVAENGNPDGPAFGDDMTITTRASDAPLAHGRLPGPPGSDRAWEQVNSPDTGGNPTNSAYAISDNGDRVVYGLLGGNPDSEIGSAFNELYAERTPTGWKSKVIYPSRAQARGNVWLAPYASNDLSTLFAVNNDTSNSGTDDLWHLSPGEPARRVYGVADSDFGGIVVISDDGSRQVMRLYNPQDPEYPGVGSGLYDVTTGTPHLVSFLPDGTPACGVGPLMSGGFEQRRVQHWLSADGSFLFFDGEPCGSGIQDFFARDLVNNTTIRVSPPPVSGQHCTPDFIRSTEDAVFFSTQSRLVAQDIEPSACSSTGVVDRDIYRFDLHDQSLECVTCVVPGVSANVASGGGTGTAVPDDGSRVYFSSGSRLVAGAASHGIYRVDVATGKLAYITQGKNSSAGSSPKEGNAINPNGSVFVFFSEDPALSFLNGPVNEGTGQYYRYDDADRSLVCVSCPPDGSAPMAAGRDFRPKVLVEGQGLGPNLGPLSNAGDLAFVTPTPLVAADQNTAPPGQHKTSGLDVYEWRDGAVHLITDGLTPTVDEPNAAPGPTVEGITPNGRDIFFSQPAKLTPDALDGYRRIYDARIGGGFEFPTPPPPCPLEACQGTPKGAPEESRPGSLDFAGAGNQASGAARCRKGKVRRSGRCVAKQHKRAKRHRRAKRSSQHRANHDRRASR